jgi:hypothetical protein
MLVTERRSTLIILL